LTHREKPLTNFAAFEFTTCYAYCEDEFNEHPDIITLRKGVTTEFLTEFGKGFKLYQAGEWGKAAEVLQGTAKVGLYTLNPV
jgi:hypothetical protein